MAMILTAAAMAASRAAAVPIPYSGAANVICNNQTGLIIWDVKQNTDGTWRYDYFFQALGPPDVLPIELPLIRQFCIQVLTDFTTADVLSLSPSSDLKDIGPVDPNCMDPFFGACFVTVMDSSQIRVIFDSPRAPTFGHFWVDIMADGDDTIPAFVPGEFVPMGDVLIPTPGVIPEPLTMLTLAGALAPLAVRLRKRFAAREQAHETRG